ncbi:Lycopene beta-cyclase [Aspergillus floccosus]
MGLDYVMVHLTYNIPLAIFMTGLSWPFLNRLDWAKISALVTVSLLGTISWDSYLVRSHIWTYPPSTVTGYTLCAIPLEEVFFFIIQTYNISLIYIALIKRPVLRRIGCASFLSSVAVGGAASFYIGGRYTYIGLIIVWAFTWLLFQWALTHRFVLALPNRKLIISVMLPTILLWIIDNFSLRRGTWVIEKPTKLDIQEAFFFFITNVLVVNGLIVADTAIALMHCQQAQSAASPQDKISTLQIMVNLITGLRASVARVANASQSMYTGSAMFNGPLRIDLVLLYSFCRIVDDLVDEAASPHVARHVIYECKKLLQAKFDSPKALATKRESTDLSSSHFSDPINAIDCLPISRLHIEPLQSLLAGFQMDLQFNAEDTQFPIATDAQLDKYASLVAGTVAACILDLVVHHYPSSTSTLIQDPALRRRIFQAGDEMGKVLQYVNLARDIGRDVAINRVYLPTSWLKQAGLSPTDVIASPFSPSVDQVRARLLVRATQYHASAVGAIQFLPVEVQGPLRATVESYMEIRKVLSRGVRPVRVGEKMRLSLYRRFVVAYKAMARS